MKAEQIAPWALAVLAACLVVAGLMIVGGPGEARRLHRDERRADDLTALSSCLAYLPREEWDKLPEVMTAGTICASRANWQDPKSEAPYTIMHNSADEIEICAEFENAGSVAKRYNLQDIFDPATGCVRVRWGG